MLSVWYGILKLFLKDYVHIMAYIKFSNLLNTVGTLLNLL